MMPIMARQSPIPVSLRDPTFLKFRWLVLYSVFTAGSVAFRRFGWSGWRPARRLCMS
jgi:hypothetical protein